MGDLYKTQVRQLAQAVGIPEVIIQKPPTADLWAGQTDEDELGFTYEEVDRLLAVLVDSRGSTEDAVKAGFAPAHVERVRAMISGSEFKRRMPLIAEVRRRYDRPS